MPDDSSSIKMVDTATGLSANDVAMAYRLLLDREPESSEAVANHIARYRDLKSFRAAVLDSAEFRSKSRPPATRPLTWPPINVDTDVSCEQLADMVRLVEGNWEELGRQEPHWSVLTHDEFKSDKIESSAAKFHQTGEHSVQIMTAAAARCGIDLRTMTTCVELGCGVGRVTVWLAKQFDRVIGVDISRPHLALANEAASRHGVGNVEFPHAAALHSLRELPRFDVLYSVIVLQHNPPPVICAILETLLSRLNPQGIAYFQVPTYRLGYQFNTVTYLASAEIRGKMEVHVVPQPVLFGIFERCNCRVLEVREDSWAGSPTFVSNSFLIQKRV